MPTVLISIGDAVNKLHRYKFDIHVSVNMLTAMHAATGAEYGFVIRKHSVAKAAIRGLLVAHKCLCSACSQVKAAYKDGLCLKHYQLWRKSDGLAKAPFKPWTERQIATLLVMRRANMACSAIAKKTGKTTKQVYAKIYHLKRVGRYAA